MESLPLEILSVEPSHLLLLLVAGLLAGLVDSIAGGGGLIALPALLTAGIPPHIALGTNKLAGTFGSFSASRAYIRKGLFKPRLWRAGTLATVLGAVVGTLVVWLTSPDILRKVVPVFIITMAAYVALHRPRNRAVTTVHAQPDPVTSSTLGAGLGFYDGFLGPGAGAFWTTGCMALYRMDIVHASGVARFMNFVSNIVSLVTFIALGSVDYVVGLAMGISLMAGAHIGASSAIRFGAPLIRPLFVLVVLALAGRLAWQEWL